MSRSRRVRPSDLRASDPALSTAAPLVIDESGANQAYDFSIHFDSAGIDVTARGRQDNGAVSYLDQSSVTIVGSIYDDNFMLDVAAISGSRLDISGGGGTDRLTATIAASVSLMTQPDGSYFGNIGTFSGLSSIALTLNEGISNIVTGSGDDRFTVNGGTVSIDGGGGDDTVTVAGGGASVRGGAGDDTFVTRAASVYQLDGGDGSDSWTASLQKPRNEPTGIVIHDGAVTIDGRSTAVSIETARLTAGGPVSLSLDGQFGAGLQSLILDGSYKISAELDFSHAGDGVTVEATGNEGSSGRVDNYSLRIEGPVAPSILIPTMRTGAIVGSAFDDRFLLHGVRDNDVVTISCDGGDGTDYLFLSTYDDYYGDLIPRVSFVVQDDGLIDSNVYHFADFEQFEIVVGDGAQIVTGQLADKITGGGTLMGGGGDDVLTAWFAHTLLDGGAGNDRLNGAADTTASYQDASAGVTVALTAGAQDTGGAGIDTLSNIANVIGSAFADTLTGDNGANTIEGNGGDDTLIGLGGVDTASYAHATAGVTVSLVVTAAQDTQGAGVDTLAGFENLTGSAFNDLLAGDAGDNVLDGGDGVDRASYAAAVAAVQVDLRLTGAQATGAGNDTLSNVEGLVGSAYDDTLTGDFRDNVIEGGGGDDVLNGTTGFDVASYAGAAGGVTVDLRLLTAQDTGTAGIDTLANFEALVGSAFADVLTGDAANNRLTGGSGDDRLAGGSGSDELRGGDGVDTAVYLSGDWSRYAVAGTRGGTYTVTNTANGEVDTLYAIEKVQLPSGIFAIADLVNAAPRARADKVGGVIEAGSAGPGNDHAAGDVLANDRDANLATAGLGETLTVTGIAAGRGATAFSAVRGERTVEGAFGTLTIHADGSFDYQLDNDRAATDALKAGRTGRDLFSYQIADAHGAVSTATLTVAVKGADDAAAFHAAPVETAVHAPFDLGAHLWSPTDLPLA